MKKALIFGVMGQDGSYLAKSLLSKGYEVYGTSRDINMGFKENHALIGISGLIRIFRVNLVDQHQVRAIISSILPDEIYILCGPSSVSESFKKPNLYRLEIPKIVENTLESVLQESEKTKIFHASSSESFGNIDSGAASELTAFNAVSPYGIAKSDSHKIVEQYKNKYSLFASNGILFNHESPLRHNNFVTKKIVHAAVQIKKGKQDSLSLGNLNIQRDWGWAPEYVNAMNLILQQDEPGDFILATGTEHSLLEFIDGAFSILGLTWNKYVTQDYKLIRPKEITRSVGNPEKARAILGWKATIEFDRIIELLVKHEIDANAFN